MQLATWGTYRFKADAQKCADEIMEIWPGKHRRI